MKKKMIYPKKPVESAQAKSSAVLKGFSEIWKSLFTTPVHLDSALSKQTPRLKSILAQIVPAILLRPVSLAETLGIGVAPGEPWSLDLDALSKWRPAHLMAERLYEGMVKGEVQPSPILEDFPPQMVNEWNSLWNEKKASELVSILGTEAPLSLRSTGKVGAAQVLAELKKGSRLPVRAELSRFAPFGIQLSGYAPVLMTEPYKKGQFEIQDEGSQWMALFALWPKEYSFLLQKTPGRVLSNVDGEKIRSHRPPSSLSQSIIVDACAGAGGKSLAMADALKGRGRVFAYDTSKTKLLALRRRAKNAHLNNIQTAQIEEGSELFFVERFKRQANVVLVDAPCTGWGVLRRNPDIKWRQRPDVLVRMPVIQERLLDCYSELVAPGGRLVYGVCTFRQAETSDVVHQFLDKNKDFKAEEGGFLGPGPCDGFFMQSMVRVG